jgi:DNA repair exonuclease SbcCD nuclease subunit
MKLANIRKIFVLGDLHLGIRNASIEWSNIQIEFLLDFFIKKVDEEGFDPERDILVQVGDWHHVRESTNVRILNLSLTVAQKLCAKFKRGVYVILGNHDVYYKDQTSVHSLKGFDQIFDNFHIFEKPKPLMINSHKFLMLPWIEDLDDLKQATSVNSDCEYIFCHADFKGASLTKSVVLEHGLTGEDTKSFKRIYSGHIHIHQNNGNLLYVGTPYEMDRGDRGNPKGFYVLDVEQKDITEKFIENTFSPKHIRHDVHKLLNLNKSKVEEIFKNNFVDLEIESEFAARFPFSIFTTLVEKFGHRRLEFYPYSLEQKSAKSQVEINDNYEYNLFTILDDHLNKLNLSGHVRDRVSEAFKNIYDSIKNTQKYDQ